MMEDIQLIIVFLALACLIVPVFMSAIIKKETYKIAFVKTFFSYKAFVFYLLSFVINKNMNSFVAFTAVVVSFIYLVIQFRNLYKYNSK